MRRELVPEQKRSYGRDFEGPGTAILGSSTVYLGKLSTRIRSVFVMVFKLLIFGKRNLDWGLMRTAVVQSVAKTYPDLSLW